MKEVWKCGELAELELGYKKKIEAEKRTAFTSTTSPPTGA